MDAQLASNQQETRSLLATCSKFEVLDMGFIKRFFIAISYGNDFRLAWLRLKHIENGHPFDKSELVDKLHSEKHPHTDRDMVFTVNIRKCSECGLIFFDNGLEYRNRHLLSIVDNRNALLAPP